jgi:hypothetical protein
MLKSHLHTSDINHMTELVYRTRNDMSLFQRMKQQLTKLITPSTNSLLKILLCRSLNVIFVLAIKPMLNGA